MFFLKQRKTNILIELGFDREGMLYLVHNESGAFSHLNNLKVVICVCDALHYLLDNILIRFCSKLHRQFKVFQRG